MSFPDSFRHVCCVIFVTLQNQLQRFHSASKRILNAALNRTISGKGRNRRPSLREDSMEPSKPLFHRKLSRVPPKPKYCFWGKQKRCNLLSATLQTRSGGANVLNRKAPPVCDSHGLLDFFQILGQTTTLFLSSPLNVRDKQTTLLRLFPSRLPSCIRHVDNAFRYSVKLIIPISTDNNSGIRLSQMIQERYSDTTSIGELEIVGISGNTLMSQLALEEFGMELKGMRQIVLRAFPLDKKYCSRIELL